MSEFVPLEPLVTEWRVIAALPDEPVIEPWQVNQVLSKTLADAEFVASYERDHRLPTVFGKRTKIVVSIESRLVGPWGPT